MWRKTNDGTTGYVSTTNPNTGAVTTSMEDNGGNSTVYTFPAPNSYGQVFVTQVQYYQGLSTLLKTIQYCYNPTGTTCQSPVTLPITALTVTTTVGTLSRKSSYTYDKYGNTLTDAEYDFGASSPTSTTTTVYGSWKWFNLRSGFLDHQQQTMHDHTDEWH